MTEHDKGGDATKKRLADEKAAREKKQAEQRDAMAGVKPTPTQEENDLAASGEHLGEHEPDGSPPDPNAPPPGEPRHTREAKPSQQPSRGDYSTRASAPAAKHE
jgi:hypothetical protein